MKYRLSLFEQLAMMLRGSPVRKIKSELKKAERYNLELDGTALEAHFLAQGDITDLVDSMVFAKENGIELTYQTAAVGQLIAKYQEKVTLLGKLKIMKEEGVDNVEDFLRTGSIQSA